jgi:uncharacterized membrane protein YdfJ with MMPL/SSD domain
MYKDMQQGSNYDLLIAGIASLCLIFIIMLILTRSVIAAAVIVGTVLLSLGTSFGLSVLIWQHILGIQLLETVCSIRNGDRSSVSHGTVRSQGPRPGPRRQTQCSAR